jgi:hypothetical protein
MTVVWLELFLNSSDSGGGTFIGSLLGTNTLLDDGQSLGQARLRREFQSTLLLDQRQEGCLGSHQIHLYNLSFKKGVWEPSQYRSSDRRYDTLSSSHMN